MHKRQVGGKREEVGGRFASRICTREKTNEAFQKKWKVSFSYILLPYGSSWTSSLINFILNKRQY